MKKTVRTVILLLSLLSVLTVTASASSEVCNWYCVRNKEHKQPALDPDMAFVEECDGYYVDKSHGDTSSDKVVYLTFDAGYENGNVAKILDVMKRQEVTGAFFVLGNLIKRDTALVKRMFVEGHLVCNHTYSHGSMVGKSCEEFGAELKRLEDACRETLGEELAKYYRPPEGKFDRDSLEYAKKLGYKTVFWSFAYADWDNAKQPDTAAAKKKIFDNIHNGAIILLHPTSATNAAILEDVIIELKAQGYRFGSLDEL